MSNIDVGRSGEILIEKFIDSEFSKIFSFSDPKTNNNEQITDILVWLDRLALLIEVKTRGQSRSSIETWAKDRIVEGVRQIKAGYKRIKSNEKIFLRNKYYNAELDCAGLYQCIGLIILVIDESCSILPSKAVLDIYEKDIPIHVFSWNDIKKMTMEINTVPDFANYLYIRSEYLKVSDIPIGCELDVIGYYKMNEYNLPSEPTDFSQGSLWEMYISTMSKQIEIRNEQNKKSKWLDSLAQFFYTSKLSESGIPDGIFYSWELSSLNRPVRAEIGERLDKIQDYFESDGEYYYFSAWNELTENWIVFYFSKMGQEKIHSTLIEFARLKLIREIDANGFKKAVFGYGFQISRTNPFRILGLASAVRISENAVSGKFSIEDVNNAKRIWPDDARFIINIEEFPPL